MTASNSFAKAILATVLSASLLTTTAWARKSQHRAAKHKKPDKAAVTQQGSVVVSKINDSVFVVATGKAYFIYRIEPETGAVKKTAEWNPYPNQLYKTLTKAALRQLQPRVIRLNNRDLLYMPTYSVVSGRITVKQHYYELREGKLVRVEISK